MDAVMVQENSHKTKNLSLFRLTLEGVTISAY